MQIFCEPHNPVDGELSQAKPEQGPIKPAWQGEQLLSNKAN